MPPEFECRQTLMFNFRFFAITGLNSDLYVFSLFFRMSLATLAPLELAALEGPGVGALTILLAVREYYKYITERNAARPEHLALQRKTEITRCDENTRDRTRGAMDPFWCVDFLLRAMN